MTRAIPGGSGAGSSGASSSSTRPPTARAATLGDALRAPSANLPQPVVLDSFPDDVEPPQEVLDPREDLWLSTSDGRFSSSVIPLHVGAAPYEETFYVHKNVLLKVEYFRKALCGEFKESETQSINLPEENPSIFHFLVAFLYEGRYVPIKPAAAVLVPDIDKGKARDVGTDTVESDSDSSNSLASDVSAQSRRRRRNRRRRREDRHVDRLRQKHPGFHRPHCNCPQCLSLNGPPCWHCAAPRVIPPVLPPPALPPTVHVVDERAFRHNRRRGMPNLPPPPPPPPPALWSDPNGSGRIRGEDMRTWLLAYELNLDVYILANKFMMDDFKREVARACIDMLETAGADAAHPAVLHLCAKMYHGLSEGDPLLKMVFARIGFLQSVLDRRARDETHEFLVGHPEIGALILRETMVRREEDYNGRNLPSMERPWFSAPMSGFRPNLDHNGPPHHARYLR